MRYRVSFESGASQVVDDRVARHLLRRFAVAGYELTRVRGGRVVTLPDGALVAVIQEAAQVDLRKSSIGVVLADTTVP
ncbi:hypothetical protein GCM10010353_47020 [Streptomyces chryseus]|nr:hypothetical protein GCM10010353_47020 [Streptomyces chryseus]